MASVSKRLLDNGKPAWIVRWRDGNGKQRSKNFERKKEADQFRLSKENELALGVFAAAPQRIGVNELYDRYIRYRYDEVSKGNLRKQTVLKQDDRMRFHILPLMGNMLISDLSRETVSQKLEQLYRGKSPGVCKLLKEHLSSMLQYGAERGLIAQNYVAASYVKAPTYRPKRDPISDAEIEQIFAAADRPNRRKAVTTQMPAMIRLAALAGLRRGEVSGLMWDDIDLDAGVLHVRRNVDCMRRVTDPKTSTSVREVPLAPSLAERLKAHRDLVGAKGFAMVTTQYRDQPLHPIAVTQRISNTIAAAGIVDAQGKPRFSAHDLRHYAASWLLRENVPVPAVSQVLGHAHSGVTMKVYAHVIPGDDSVRTAMQRKAL